ncbi:glycosyltransferase domain-containing protein [Halomonas sp. BC04]|uniref:glycosyltransferase domain-containing protein n=1 Tax=Halomonas sp. BC04 TaxID=1403540 RepID=UPI0018CC100C|nr:glycosyltransferase domain-containing protein [Halomonas sp. BC04]
MNKNIVYTAMFGLYDNLLDPLVVSKNCDYICFTDQKNLSSKVWRFIHVEDNCSPPNLMNRKFKLLPHRYLSHYDNSLYIDSNIGIKNNPDELFLRLSKSSSLFAPKHPFRNCIYDELKECYETRKISYSKMIDLKKMFEDEGYPKKNGLNENNILLRMHNDESVIELMNEWYFFLINYSSRDQLSLRYVAWKKNFAIKILDESSKKPNKYFFFRQHAASGNGCGWLKRLAMSISARRADGLVSYCSAKSLDFILCKIKK